MEKMKRVALMVICVAVLMVASSGAVFATDSPSSWAADQVNAAIEKGLVPPNLQSAYTQAINRVEFSALVIAFYEKIRGEIVGRVHFDDTDDVNVQKAAYIGVVTGVGNNNFDPNSQLTREQAAVMLSRLADAIGYPFPTQAATFADNAEIASWAFEGVGRVQAAGIMSGVGDNRFAPQGPYTREQSIVTIMRMFETLEYTYEFVGSIFVSPAFNLIMLISHPDWHFAHDERTGIVYFFNDVDICEASLISMSAIEFSGDARRAIEQRWDLIRRGYERAEDFGFVYRGSSAIQVGENYSGNLHRFEFREEGIVFTSNVVLWTADNLLYTIVTTATTQRVEEVEGVLQGFLETFTNLSELMIDW